MKNKEKYKAKYEDRVELPSGLSNIDCPNCHTPIKDNAVERNRNVVCNNCGTAFKIDGDLAIFKRNKPFVQLPKNIEYLKLYSMLEFIYKPQGFAVNFMLFFTLFWNLFMVAFVMAIFSSGSENFGALVPLSLHLLIGAGLAVHSIGNLLNKVYVTIDDAYIFVEKRPIQIFKSKPIAIADVKQFFVKKYEAGKINDRPVFAFALYVRLINGKEIRLIKDFSKVEHAQYVEQEIEIFLKIIDDDIAGEYRGNS